MESLIGCVFGRLTVNGGPNSANKYRQKMWDCICECGQICQVSTNKLTTGWTRSCGCLRKETTRKMATEYNAWRSSNMNYVTGFANLYNGYRKRAEQKGRVFDLSVDQFYALTKGLCWYCNTPPAQIRNEYIFNGIDRLDNAAGYTLSNCVSCCRRCNIAKHNMSYQEFIELIHNIYRHRCINEQ